MNQVSDGFPHNSSISLVLPYFERPDLLLQSLKVLNFLYHEEYFEVIIVDDGSETTRRPIFPEDWRIRTTIITILKKKGINPCLPINIGVRHANGENILLSSPEIIQSENIFKMLPLTVPNGNIYVLPVFAVTDPRINQTLLAEKKASKIIKRIQGLESSFLSDLGKYGNLDQNDIGRWYCHKKHNPSDLNFLMLMTKEDFYSISGFDENYRFGTGFDDYEFRRRLYRAGSKFVYLETSTAIHLDHEEVSSRSEFGLGPNSNEKLFRKRWYRYRKNESWGRFPEIDVLRVNY